MDVYVEERPWGKFEKFIENEKCTVKILYLNPNSQTSLQYHDKRDEWWKIIKGSIIIYIDDQFLFFAEHSCKIYGLIIR